MKLFVILFFILLNVIFLLAYYDFIEIPFLQSYSDLSIRVHKSSLYPLLSILLEIEVLKARVFVYLREDVSTVMFINPSMLNHCFLILNIIQKNMTFDNVNDYKIRIDMKEIKILEVFYQNNFFSVTSTGPNRVYYICIGMEESWNCEPDLTSYQIYPKLTNCRNSLDMMNENIYFFYKNFIFKTTPRNHGIYRVFRFNQFITRTHPKRFRISKEKFSINLTKITFPLECKFLNHDNWIYTEEKTTVINFKAEPLKGLPASLLRISLKCGKNVYEFAQEFENSRYLNNIAWLIPNNIKLIDIFLNQEYSDVKILVEERDIEAFKEISQIRNMRHNSILFLDNFANKKVEIKLSTEYDDCIIFVNSHNENVLSRVIGVPQKKKSFKYLNIHKLKKSVNNKIVVQLPHSTSFYRVQVICLTRIEKSFECFWYSENVNIYTLKSNNNIECKIRRNPEAKFETVAFPNKTEDTLQLGKLIIKAIFSGVELIFPRIVFFVEKKLFQIKSDTIFVPPYKHYLKIEASKKDIHSIIWIGDSNKWLVTQKSLEEVITNGLYINVSREVFNYATNVITLKTLESEYDFLIKVRIRQLPNTRRDLFSDYEYDKKFYDFKNKGEKIKSNFLKVPIFLFLKFLIREI